MIRLHWNNGRLMQGKRYMPIEVLPDRQWPGMYRVRYQGKISDLVNLTRAKDAAVALVEASLNALQKPRPFSPAVGEREKSHQRPPQGRRDLCPLGSEECGDAMSGAAQGDPLVALPSPWARIIGAVRP